MKKIFDPDAASSGEGVFGIPQSDSALFSLIPVPWDATASYGKGTNKGPAQLYNASQQVDLEDVDVGPVWKKGFNWIQQSLKINKWNNEAIKISKLNRKRALNQINRFSERLNQLVYKLSMNAYEKSSVPVIIGGEHSVSFGGIKAFADKNNRSKIGILHIDAHADLRPHFEGYEYSHASIMHNVLEKIPNVSTLVQVGIRDIGKVEYDLIKRDRRIHTFFDKRIAEELLRGKTFQSIVNKIVELLPKRIWISIDVDGLKYSYCPSTGTPVPGGLDFWQLYFLLEAASKRSNIAGFDIVEIGNSEWDGNVAARILYKLCGLIIH